MIQGDIFVEILRLATRLCSIKLAEKTTRLGSDSFNRSSHQIIGNAKRPSRAHGIRKESGPTFHIIRLWNLPIVASKEQLEYFPELGLSCER